MLNVRLKTMRKNAKKTQQEIADYLGITRSAYTAYEINRRTPDHETLSKLAKFYDVSVDYLMGRDNSKLTKDERDIAKQLILFREEIENSDGLAFDGEPMSEEAKESLIESMEHIFRQTQRINKKYIPKKYREDDQ